MQAETRIKTLYIPPPVKFFPCLLSKAQLQEQRSSERCRCWVRGGHRAKPCPGGNVPEGQPWWGPAGCGRGGILRDAVMVGSCGMWPWLELFLTRKPLPLLCMFGVFHLFPAAMISVHTCVSCTHIHTCVGASTGCPCEVRPTKHQPGAGAAGP